MYNKARLYPCFSQFHASVCPNVIASAASASECNLSCAYSYTYTYYTKRERWLYTATHYTAIHEGKDIEYCKHVYPSVYGLSIVIVATCSYTWCVSVYTRDAEYKLIRENNPSICKVNSRLIDELYAVMRLIVFASLERLVRTRAKCTLREERGNTAIC